MLRKLAMFVSATTVGMLAFVAVSGATDRSPEFPKGLAVADLPIAPISGSELADIANLIDADAKAAIGISPESYSKARRLAETAAGPLYVLPGTDGVCVVLLPAAACGPVSDGAQPVSVFVPAPGGSHLVGGGVHPPGTTARIVQADGAELSPTAIPGGFIVSEAQRVKAGQFLEIAAR